MTVSKADWDFCPGNNGLADIVTDGTKVLRIDTTGAGVRTFHLLHKNVLGLLDGEVRAQLKWANLANFIVAEALFRADAPALNLAYAAGVWASVGQIVMELYKVVGGVWVWLGTGGAVPVDGLVWSEWRFRCYDTPLVPGGVRFTYEYRVPPATGWTLGSTVDDTVWKVLHGVPGRIGFGGDSGGVGLRQVKFDDVMIGKRGFVYP